MNARLINMTDEEVVKWVRKQIALRKLLTKHCRDIAYDESSSEKIMIYSPKDFIRISKLLDAKVKIIEDPICSYALKFIGMFRYHNVKIVSYGCTREDFNE